MTIGDPPRLPRDTPQSAKIGIKLRREVAAAQSVLFACGLRATEFLCIGGNKEGMKRRHENRVLEED
jgi:hypothetical protein